MHDVVTLTTRPGLPMNDFMSKVEPISVATATDHAMVVDTKVEHLDGSTGTAETFVSIGNADESPEVPQPVTPESPRIVVADNGNNPSPITDRHRRCPTASSIEPKTDETGDSEVPQTPFLPNSPVGESQQNRDRIHSLDQGKESYRRDGFNSPDNKSLTDDERNRRYVEDRSSRSLEAKERVDDDVSSSDDDSSYFATHLPSPKSGRISSYSSTGSAQAVAPNFYQNNAAKESDASLSFSDESDEEMNRHAGVHISPMIPAKATLVDMHLYPQRITRMHSVSSLVSSDSEEEKTSQHRSRASSMSSNATGTSSDPSVRAELRAVAGETRPGSHLSEASGRRSPVLGQHAGPGYYYPSPSPGQPQTSPPPILQGYAPPSGMLHPQPQPMSHDQMAAWMNVGNPALQLFQAGQQHIGYSSLLQLPQPGLSAMAPVPTGYGTASEPSSSFVYSEDEEVSEEKMVAHTVGGLAPASGQGANLGGHGGTDPLRQIREFSRASGGGFHQPNFEPRSEAKLAVAGENSGTMDHSSTPGERGFKVYWQRWLMLLYMSILNLLSDWTCYSVAPIALLTEQAFGDIDPERLVVVFLGANAIATAAEPILLSRLGLRRTVVFGSLLLMIGSIVKSGGVPPILKSDIVMGHDEWRLYLGFFLVGLSQPLYQCTPALLSASWFPEVERTMATGVALNANQLGIGFAFIFGTLLVAEKEDIIPYFGLLSTLSTIVFLGTLVQFDDAPPTPPSSSARAMRGTLEVNLPSIDTIVQSMRGGLVSSERLKEAGERVAASPSPAASHPVREKPVNSKRRNNREKSRNRGNNSGRKASATRRRAGSRSQTANADIGLTTPSSALCGPTSQVSHEISQLKLESAGFGIHAPSPMIPGRVDAGNDEEDITGSGLYDHPGTEHDQEGLNQPPQQGENPMLQGQPGGPQPPGMVPPFGAIPHPAYQYPYWDPRFQQQLQQQQAFYQQQYYYYQQQAPPLPQPYYYPISYPHQPMEHPFYQTALPPAAPVDEGAEPIVTITPHHLDIDIRDDQVIRSLRACFARKGFIHALVAFTVSGIVINTLSTYMDYLVRLNGGPRAYTGIVGGTFQFVIMISSLIIGKWTDKTRAYYSVTIGMLVLGAFGLAECGVSLDADRGNDLRYTLVVVAALVGPLQPVSTELGVDVVYPLSENTVLVIQQLFSNLLSAMFIPLFKALKDVGAETFDANGTEVYERPQYTFSFYLLIVLHTAATVFFATFNGKYLRYEHELQRKAEEEQRDIDAGGSNAFHPIYGTSGDYREPEDTELRRPLVQTSAV